MSVIPEDDELSAWVNSLSSESPVVKKKNNRATALQKAADDLGVDAGDLGSIISFETGGTFDPHKVGGEGNRYKGLIQFGPDEQRKYYRPNDTFETQLEKGVVPYFRDRFAKAGKDPRGASLEDLYTTVIAGNPAANRNARDSFGTSARSGTQKILNEHRPKVLKDIFGGQDTRIDPDSIWAGIGDLTDPDEVWAGIDLGDTPAQPDPNKPATEHPDTMKMQRDAAVDMNVKSRYGVHPTTPEQDAELANDPALQRFLDKDDKPVYINVKKALQKRGGIKGLKDINHLRTWAAKNPDALTTIIGIPPENNVGDDSRGIAVTAQQNGKEAATAVVTSPEGAIKQAENYKDQFPDAQIGLTTSDDIVAQRAMPPIETLGGLEGVAPDTAPPMTQAGGLMYGDPRQRQTVSPRQRIAQKPVQKQQAGQPLMTTSADLQSANEYLNSQGQAPLSQEQFDALVKSSKGYGEVTGAGVQAIVDGDKQTPISEYEQETPAYGGSVRFPREVGKPTDENGDVGRFRTTEKMTEAQAFRASLLAVGSKYGIDPEKVEREVRSRGGKGFFTKSGGYTPGAEVVIDKNSLIAMGVDPAAFRMEETQNRVEQPLSLKTPEIKTKPVLTPEQEETAKGLGRATYMTPDFGVTTGILKDVGEGWAPFLSGVYQTSFGAAKNVIQDLVFGQHEDSDAVTKALEKGGAFISKVAEGAKREGALYEAGEFAGEVGAAAPRYIVTTVGSGGNPIVGMAAEAGLRGVGRGDDPDKVLGAIGKGAALGVIFHGSSKLGDFIGKKVFGKVVDAETRAALENPVMRNAYNDAIKAGEKVELSPNLKKAVFLGQLAKNTTRLGTVGTFGTAEGLAEGQDIRTAAKQGALWMVQDVALSYLMGGKGRRLEDLEGRVIRVPDESGKPKDILLLKGEKGLDAHDVTGVVPVDPDAVVLPQIEGSVAKNAEKFIPKLTDEDVAKAESGAKQVVKEGAVIGEPKIEVSPERRETDRRKLVRKDEAEIDRRNVERRREAESLANIKPVNVHNLATDKDINPNEEWFKDKTEQMTGHRNLDDPAMTKKQLVQVSKAIESGEFVVPEKGFDIVSPEAKSETQAEKPLTGEGQNDKTVAAFTDAELPVARKEALKAAESAERQLALAQKRLAAATADRDIQAQTLKVQDEGTQAKRWRNIVKKIDARLASEATGERIEAKPPLTEAAARSQRTFPKLIRRTTPISESRKARQLEILKSGVRSESKAERPDSVVAMSESVKPKVADATDFLPHDSYVAAQKRPDGQWRLVYRGTNNDVFEGELFKSSAEARRTYRAEKLKRDEAYKKRTQTPVDVPTLPKTEQVSVTADPSVKETRQSVKQEKQNPRTGLTETQTEYLAKHLRDAAYKASEIEDIDHFVKEMGAEGFPIYNNSLGDKKITLPDYIKVPGDGSFKVFNIGQANNLHQKITGKPIPGFEKSRTATTPRLGADVNNARMKAPSLGRPSKEVIEKIAIDQEALNRRAARGETADDYGDYEDYGVKPSVWREYQKQARKATDEQLLDGEVSLAGKDARARRAAVEQEVEDRELGNEYQRRLNEREAERERKAKESELERLRARTDVGDATDQMRKERIAELEQELKTSEQASPTAATKGETKPTVAEGETLGMARQSDALEMARFPEHQIRAEQRQFAKDVDAVLEDAGRGEIPEVLSSAPPLLQKLGLIDAEIVMPQAVVRKALGGGARGHNIAPDVLKQLPYELNDPVMVFDSLRDDNALLILTSLENKDGHPVVAVIKYDGEIGRHKVNVIPSVHEKNRSGFVTDWAERGKLRYYNKEKGRVWLRKVGLQLPETETKLTTSSKILTDEDFVNPLEKSRTAKSEARLKEAEGKDFTPEDIAGIKSTVTKHGVELDEYALELANRIAKSAGLVRKGKSRFDGVFLDPKQLRKFIREVEYTAAAMDDEKAAKALIKLADDIETRYDKVGVATIYTYDDAREHESDHEADYRGSMDEKGIAKKLEERYNGAFETLADTSTDVGKAFKRFTDAFVKDHRSGTPVKHGVAIAEALAYLGRGRYAEFGLTKEESVDILAIIVTGYDQANSTVKGSGDSLRYFEQGTHLYEVIEQFGKEQSSERSDDGRSEVSGEREARPEEVETKPDDTGDAERATEQKERKTVKTTHELGILNKNKTGEGTRYYDQKHNEPVERAAQDYVERVGFQNAFNEAILPAGDNTNKLDHEARQMAVIQLLNGQQMAALNAGNTEAADYYETQTQAVMRALAPEATEAGQMVQLLSRWKIANPATVLARVRLDRMQNGLSPELEKEAQKKLVEQAEKLQNANIQIDALNAKIADLEAGKKQYQSKGGKTKPLTKSEKTVLDSLNKLRSEAIARVRQLNEPIANETLQMARPTSLQDEVLNDLTDIGAAILLEGWHGDPITGEQFEKEFAKEVGGNQYARHYREIHAKSVTKMETLIKEQKQKDTIAILKAEEGNANKTDEELLKIAEERKTEQKAKNAIRAEHRKLAKKYQVEEAFAGKAESIRPDVSEQVMAGVLARQSGAKSFDDVRDVLRKEYPDDFKPEKNDTPEVRKRKLSALNSAIAEAETLYKQTSREIFRERQEKRQENLSEDERKELAQAKADRREATKDLSNLVQENTKPPGGILHGIAQVSRAAKVALIQTAATNLISTKVEQTLVNKPIDSLDIALQKTFGLKGEGLDPNASFATAWWTPNTKQTVYDADVKEYAKGLSKHEILLRAIDEHPEYFTKFFGDISPDLHSGVSKILDKIMIPMRIQEFFMRDSAAVKALAQRAAMKGLDFKKIIESGDYTSFSKADMEYALTEARSLTYSLRPQKGKGVTDTVFAGAVSAIRYSGVLDLMGSESAPFLNFMYNTVNKYKTKIPVMAQARLGAKTIASAKRLKQAGEEPSYIKEAIKENWTSRQIANQMWGVIALGAMYALVRNLGDKDDWNKFKIPFTEGMGRETTQYPNGEPLYFDIRTQPLMAPFAFLASKFHRITSGKDAFTYGYADEISEAFLGLSYRGNVEQNAMFKALWYSGAKALDAAKGTDENIERNGERAFYFFRKALGNDLGTMTNFLQFKTMKDIAAQFDEIEKKPLNLDDYPFTEGVANRLPESRRLLKDILGLQVEAKKNYATDKENVRTPFPILKVLGFNLADGADLRPTPSQAEILAAKLAYGDKAYKPPELADEQKIADIKRDFRKEGERLAGASKEEQDALKTKLKGMDDLRPGQIKYAQRQLYASDLADNFKQLTYTQAAQVWDAQMTEDQRKELKPLYAEKLKNAAEDNKKSKAERQKAREMYRELTGKGLMLTPDAPAAPQPNFTPPPQ